MKITATDVMADGIDTYYMAKPGSYPRVITLKSDSVVRWIRLAQVTVIRQRFSYGAWVQTGIFAGAYDTEHEALCVAIAMAEKRIKTTEQTLDRMHANLNALRFRVTDGLKKDGE